MDISPQKCIWQSAVEQTKSAMSRVSQMQEIAQDEESFRQMVDRAPCGEFMNAEPRCVTDFGKAYSCWIPTVLLSGRKNAVSPKFHLVLSSLI